jgi:hypothetical protein
VKTGNGKGETEKPCGEWQVDMLLSQHSVAMAGRFGVGVPAGRWQAGVKRAGRRSPAAQQHAACIRFYLISLAKSPPQAPPPTPPPAP